MLRSYSLCVPNQNNIMLYPSPSVSWFEEYKYIHNHTYLCKDTWQPNKFTWITGRGISTQQHLKKNKFSCSLLKYESITASEIRPLKLHFGVMFGYMYVLGREKYQLSTATLIRQSVTPTAWIARYTALQRCKV